MVIFQDNPRSFRRRSYMRYVPVLSTDGEINRNIEKICANIEDFEPVFFSDKDAFVHYLNYEIPEIDIINYSDSEAHIDQTLEAIKSDPWLHYGGSVILYRDINEPELNEQLGGVNIIALIHTSRLSAYLPRVFHVLNQNRSILFQRDIHALLQSNLSGTFELMNDPFDAATYSNLLSNFLYNSNLIASEARDTFYSALMELLMNSIEHGNCNISHDEKTAYLAQNQDIIGLIRSKLEDPFIQARRIHLDYRITPARSYFTIRDEGEGFDWQSYHEPTAEEQEQKLHGRGIMMARHYLRNLEYRGKGNEVLFEVDHLVAESNTIPGVFTDQEEVTFLDGDVVFEQGDKSSHLYYIISGQFDIIANGKKVSTLTPADIFLGEMSFLLNNRRSATVKTVGWGKLIRISKEAFINSIKEQPHYGIFLARLLAQRLDQIHDITV